MPPKNNTIINHPVSNEANHVNETIIIKLAIVTHKNPIGMNESHRINLPKVVSQNETDSWFIWLNFEPSSPEVLKKEQKKRGL